MQEVKGKIFACPDDIARVEFVIPEHDPRVPFEWCKTFKQIRFVECDFSGVNLGVEHWFKFTSCEFDRCSFRRSAMNYFNYCKFFGCDFREADFTNAWVVGSTTVGCRCDKAKFHGMIMRLECHFFDGLISEREADGWKLAWFSSLPQTPAQAKIRDAVPKDLRLCLEKTFEVD